MQTADLIRDSLSGLVRLKPRAAAGISMMPIRNRWFEALGSEKNEKKYCFFLSAGRRLARSTAGIALNFPATCSAKSER